MTLRLGTTALVLILFDGGLNTPFAALREAIRPAAVLATVGVAGTAALVAVAAHLLGFDWMHALLLGAIVSSTDAAAVFSVLRGSGLQLQRRVGMTLELESGLNDPMAVILTLALTGALTGQGFSLRAAILDGIQQLALGALGGAAIGWLGRQVLQRAQLAAGGLYPVLTLALALIAFSAPTLVDGSGFLAVYIAGVVMGNGASPVSRRPLARARRHRLARAGRHVPAARADRLSFAPARGRARGTRARALRSPSSRARSSCCLSLAPFRFPLRETLYVGWVGLRGAVPIILATFPVLRRRARGEAPLRRRLLHRGGERDCPRLDGPVAPRAC